MIFAEDKDHENKRFNDIAIVFMFCDGSTVWFAKKELS